MGLVAADDPAKAAVRSNEAATASTVRETIAGTEGVSASDIAIELSNLSYIYEGETEEVLRNVSLTVRNGEFVLILGPSGCGKSTLLQLLNGTIPHALKGRLEGDAFVCGKPTLTTTIASFATEVGMVFQDPEAQIINTRVRDEVCFGLENLCRPADEILARQQEALVVVGLDGFGDRSIFDLSGGQKQRVSIAAVLAARPRLLVLDEPTANLDPAGMVEIFAVLERLNREAGTTIVMVEHRVDELADRVSRVIMMDRGSIVFDGTPREAFSQRRTAHSEEDAAVPTSAWFPQACEFALALGVQLGIPIDPGSIPLNVDEAVVFADRCLATPVNSIQSPAPVLTRSSAANGTAFLQVNRLSFGYEKKQPVLNDVSFGIGRGEMIALCGRNGSGKTTLARLLMHINAPARGTIWLEGKDVADLSAREISSEIGYVFQNPDHQFVTDRVWDEIAYGLRVRNYADDAIEERVDEVLDIVDLTRDRDRSPFSLSLGERRRLSVATMLVLEPHLLVLDEPTIGQDYERAQQLMGLMARLRERYRTSILMITHDVRLIAEWADRALVIGGGRLLFDGSPEAMFADDRLIADAGLSTPPVYEISKALAARHPERQLQPTVSLQVLADSIARTGGNAA
jgi:energy-coupling factor transport system ATP-binding protein